MTQTFQKGDVVEALEGARTTDITPGRHYVVYEASPSGSIYHEDDVGFMRLRTETNYHLVQRPGVSHMIVATLYTFISDGDDVLDQHFEVLFTASNAEAAIARTLQALRERGVEVSADANDSIGRMTDTNARKGVRLGDSQWLSLNRVPHVT
jgi:hypothetical protein